MRTTTRLALLLPRAAEDAAGASAAWQAAGITHVISAPVTTLQPHDTPAPWATPDGIIITSRHTPRFKPAHDLPAAWRAAPLVVVGEQTAAAVLAHGYAPPHYIAADGRRLANWMLHEGSVGRPGDVWGHLGGVAHGDEPAASLANGGVRTAFWSVYDATATHDLPAPAWAALRDGAGAHVAFYSPRQAALWVALMQAKGLEACCSRLDALCLSQAVANAARAVAWRRVIVATAPTEAALIATLDAL